MIILMRYLLNHKSNYKSLLKIVTCIFISLLCKYNNDNTVSKSLEYGSIFDISLNRRTHRVLSRYEKQNDIRNTRLQNKAPPNEDNYKIANIKENNNKYENLKQGRANHMEAYLNSFKLRHSKKSGLKKLDCYYEKKLFSSIFKIENIAKKKNISKGRIKRIVYTKYGIPLILFCLTPLLILGIYAKKAGIRHTLSNCKVVYKKPVQPENLLYVNHNACKFETVIDTTLHQILTFISFTIIISFIIYTYIKLKKYQRIKEGMSK
ncbi:hypothetical protein PVIIG_05559 [Plasmodium vivax India VII]|uniref:Variable surface protein Vir35 n=1 Tax=Plasmodium vivax India VII TaxID=1077284 RepID=A0A0J9V8M4_PLAVI|nr:hypothetical protein PVIIG_05559 [Plasmodium vivax India VII]